MERCEGCGDDAEGGSRFCDACRDEVFWIHVDEWQARKQAEQETE
jgi:hypothetical protein